MRGIGTAALALALVLAAGTSEAQNRQRRAKPEEPAAAGTTSAERIGDWMLRCDPPADGLPKQCEMAQILSDKEGKRDLLLIRLGYPPAESDALALIVVPLDVLLPPGSASRSTPATRRSCRSGIATPTAAWRPGDRPRPRSTR